MAVEVIPVRSSRELKRFLALPWRIYKGDPCWVPPLLGELRRQLTATDRRPGAFTRELWLALADGRPAGRLHVAIDHDLNARKGVQNGYFSLFECVDDQAVCAALFQAAERWLRDRQMTVLKGPVSPEGPHGDDNKGLLISGFDRPPVLMTSYNPPYYQTLLERQGYAKDFDVFAYLLDKDRLFARDPERVIDLAQRRYKFRIDRIDLRQFDAETAAIKHVLDLAVPAEWPDMVPPTLDEVRAMARRMLPIADPALLYMARAGDEPIGFGVALPDYNQVLRHLNGRMTPLGLLKFLYYRRRITWARIFIVFVVPAFRRKAVSHAIYYNIFRHGVAKGYAHGEGSTIGEENREMRADIESIGGQHYKTYRIFSKVIGQ